MGVSRPIGRPVPFRYPNPSFRIMDFWTAAVAIVAIIFISTNLQARYKARQGQALDKPGKERIDALERRVESLETLVLELDKEKRFRDLS
jgi:hypothetical protein